MDVGDADTAADGDAAAAAATAPSSSAARPLHLAAGGTLLLAVPYKPLAPGVVTIQSVSIQIGEEPSALFLGVPLVALDADSRARGGAVVRAPLAPPRPPRPRRRRARRSRDCRSSRRCLT